MDFHVTYDGQVDAAYIYLVPIGPGEAAVTVPRMDEASSVNLDFDAEGRLIGIEVLDARRSLPAQVIDRAERLA